MSWANLTGADVTGATFKETNLDNANLRDVVGFNLDSYDYEIYLNNPEEHPQKHQLGGCYVGNHEVEQLGIERFTVKELKGM